MAQIPDYGRAIAAATTCLSQLVRASVGPIPVTTRTLAAARSGLGTSSVNIFLYQDAPAHELGGGASSGAPTQVAELQYLVTVFPGDERDPGDAENLHGAIREAIARQPVATLELSDGSVATIRFDTVELSITDVTAIWAASEVPLRLSLPVRAAVGVRSERSARSWRANGHEEYGRSDRRDAVDTGPVPDTSAVAVQSEGGARVDPEALREVVDVAQPGLIVVFEGPDDHTKALAAASVAERLGEILVKIRPDRIVSKYVAETEQNLNEMFTRLDGDEWVLYFDEADALFGRRTDVNDAHDRYADVDPLPVLDLLARAPGVVLLPIHDPGDELRSRAAIIVRFPPTAR